MVMKACHSHLFLKQHHNLGKKLLILPVCDHIHGKTLVSLRVYDFIIAYKLLIVGFDDCYLTISLKHII